MDIENPDTDIENLDIKEYPIEQCNFTPSGVPASVRYRREGREEELNLKPSLVLSNTDDKPRAFTHYRALDGQKERYQIVAIPLTGKGMMRIADVGEFKGIEHTLALEGKVLKGFVPESD